MKKAFSNIAWTKDDDSIVYEILKNSGFDGIEIAPTRVWDNLSNLKASDLLNYKNEMSDFGMNIVAMQALLYGYPQYTIFENSNIRKVTLEYLKQCILIASGIGAKVLVFGSPKNRVIGDLERGKAMSVAVDFFSELGEYADKHNTVFCIEANPKEYKTDFINTTYEAFSFVKDVNTKGFGLHIDTGTILMNSSSVNMIEDMIEYIFHFHISEPWLKPISKSNKKFHMEIASLLNCLNYNAWVSVEMGKGNTESVIETVKSVAEFISEIYG